MRTGIAHCASALAVAVLTSSAFAAPNNLLSNGSFDQKPATAKLNKSGIIPITTRANGAALPGWTVLGPVDLVSTRLWQAPEGATYSVDLTGSPGVGGIEQVIDTAESEDWVEGHEYQLSFDLSVNPQPGPRKEKAVTKYLRVEILGGEDDLLAWGDYSITNGTRTLRNMQWADGSDFAESEGGDLTFTYSGGDVTVRFLSVAPGQSEMPKKAKASTLYCGPVIGNVNLFDLGGGTPTPEPASLGILGVGASALILKRRRGR